MKIVSSAGFGFTGSTAITDLISEYSSVSSLEVPSYELSFFNVSHGILNLYNNMVKNPIPDLMHYAGKDYLKQCEIWANYGNKINHEKVFNNHFMEYSKEYIENLGNNTYYCNHSWEKMTSLQSLLFKVINKLYHISHSIGRKAGYGEQNIEPLTLFSVIEKNYLYDVDEEKFETETKKYFSKLFDEVTDGKIVNVHSLIPIQMIDECARFFDDICVVAVDRDPRDIYLTAKHKWKTLDYPFEDVHFYCDYYKWLRSRLKDEKTNVLRLQFEDLVYNYDQTVEKIENFVGLNPQDHTNIKKKFVPDFSAKNCNLSEQYEEEKSNIQVIEKELEQWLYDFDNHKKMRKADNA